MKKRGLNLPLRQTTQGICLATALCCATAPAAAADAEPLQVAQVAAEYSIPAGPLRSALAQLASGAGISLSFDPALVAGKRSSGLSGRYTLEEAFSRLLAGTGLEAVARQGGYGLREQTQGTMTLAPVRVEADTHSDPGRTEGSRDYAARSTNTAFKLPLTPRETPQTVTVVPQAVIKDFGLKDIRQILQFTPGVTVSAERGPQAYYFESRGNPMEVQFDGVPSSNNFGGRGAGMNFDAATIDRVEVISGAAGLLTGPGAPGGTVNVVRKLPTEDAQVALEAGGDSWGGWRTTADASGPLGDSGWGGRIVGVYERKDYYIDYTDAKHSVLYGVVGRRFGDSTEFYAGANIEQTTDGSYGSHYGLPSNVDGSSLNLPRTINLGATWADTDESFNTVFLRLRHEFAQDWSLHAMLTYEDYDTSQLEANAGFVRDPDMLDTLLLFAAIENWKSDSVGLDLYLQGAFELFGREHELMAGFNGLRRKEAGDYSASPAPLAEIDPATWDARNAPNPYSQGIDFIYGYSGEYEQYGTFAGTRLSLADPLHLIVGTRLSWVEQKWDGATDSKESGVSTFYGGLVWDFAEHWSAYTSYSDIFEPHPTYVRDRNGEVLDPIVGENSEVGLKFEAYEGRLNAALALFRLDQNNLADTDYEGQAPGICGDEILGFCSKASGLVRSEGFELSVSGEILRGWQVYGGYTAFDREYRTEAGEDPYDAKTPTKYFSVATTYSAPGDRWQVGASARWQEDVAYNGSIFFLPPDEGAFSVQQKAVTIAGLFGAYQLTQTLRINAAVDNLFDETYYSGLEWPLGGVVYGDARKVSVTLRAEF